MAGRVRAPVSNRALPDLHDAREQELAVGPAVYLARARGVSRVLRGKPEPSQPAPSVRLLVTVHIRSGTTPCGVVCRDSTGLRHTRAWRRSNKVRTEGMTLRDYCLHLSPPSTRGEPPRGAKKPLSTGRQECMFLICLEGCRLRCALR